MYDTYFTYTIIGNSTVSVVITVQFLWSC